MAGIPGALASIGKFIAEKGLDDVELHLGDYIGIANQQPSFLPTHEDAKTSRSKSLAKNWREKMS